MSLGLCQVRSGEDQSFEVGKGNLQAGVTNTKAFIIVDWCQRLGCVSLNGLAKRGGQCSPLEE